MVIKMKILLIIAVIAALLLLLLTCRLRIRIVFINSKARLTIKIGRLPVFSMLILSDEKKKKTKKEKKDKANRKTVDIKLVINSFFDTASSVKSFFEKVIESMRIENLSINAVTASENPATAALAYGAACAALGPLNSFIESNFIVEKRDIKLGFSFERTSPSIDIDCTFAIQIFKLLKSVHDFIWSLLKIFVKSKKNKKVGLKNGRTSD